MQIRSAWQKSPVQGVLCAVLLALIWGFIGVQARVTQAGSGDLMWTGLIETMPTEGEMNGNWRVAERDFVADDDTEFYEEKGELVVGACAMVKYTVDQGVNRAKKILSQPTEDCEKEEGDHQGNAGGLKWRGTVESAPADGGQIGEWSVRGRLFAADGNTVFDSHEGAIDVGSCVKTHYKIKDDGSYLALKFESEPTEECADDDEAHEAEEKVYGRVEVMPELDFIGEWTIGGAVYTVDAETYIEQEHGGLDVGACVKVEFIPGTPALSKEIETEPGYKCDGQGSDDDDNEDSSAYPKGELYGVIRTLPEDGLIGQWMVGSIPISVTEQTRLIAPKSPFEAGVLVKVKFYTNDTDENIALIIISKYKTDDEGDDDDNGLHEGKEGHAFGILEALPTGSLGIYGTWTISAIDYYVNDQTKLDAKGLEVGVQVKVKYYVNANGTRIAKKISVSQRNGDPSTPNHYKSYGFVEQLPVGGLNGQWQIDGVLFVVDQSTKFKDSRGVVVEGSYVEVEYLVANGVNRLTEVEVHVPPGAGEHDRRGQLESISELAGAEIEATSSIWVVDGQSYTVTDATSLNDVNNDLQVGDTVTINSYTAADGTNVATLVNWAESNISLYLPTVAR